MVLAGVISILFGIGVLLGPAAGALAIVWIIAVYAMFFGIPLIMLGFRVRGSHPTVRR